MDKLLGLGKQTKEIGKQAQEQLKKAGESIKKVSKQLIRRSLADAVRDYIASTLNNTTDQFIAELTAEIQEFHKVLKDEDKGSLVQQIIFLNLLGYDTTWADFMILEVMSTSDYSLKRLCYTAAGFLWNSQSDVVLMATNRIGKDLTTNNPLFSSLVLSGVTSFLSDNISQHISNDVIAFMKSARADVRQKAITNFYNICLRYPDALRIGFPALKACLDDTEPSVLFATLNVMNEFCRHNPQNFTSLIPKFYKMLDAPPNNWCCLKLISLLRMLCDVEPRLPKKLIAPFTTLLETTGSATVLFELVKTIIEVPITNTVLLTYATQRMQNFIDNQDANLRFLCLKLFIKLMEIQPKLVAQNKEIISNCLDSNDEATRLLALDLLAALANSKTIDGIVAKMFHHYKESLSVTFKNTVITRIIEVCSKNDYAVITDFSWYITIIGDFIEEGGFTCYEIIANQFMDLATRVPATRENLVEQMGKILGMRNYRDATKLLLTALYIIGEYSENAKQLPRIINENILFCDERVQVSALSTAFKLYIRCETEKEQTDAENLFKERLPDFQTGIYAEVQDIAAITIQLIDTFKAPEAAEAFSEIKTKLTTEYDEDTLPPLEVPEELNEPIDDTFKVSDDDDDFLKEDTNGPIDPLVEATASEVSKQKKAEKPKKEKIKVRKQKQNTDRQNVVIKAAKKPLFGQPEKKPNALADKFADINLNEPAPAPAPAKPKPKKDELKMAPKKTEPKPAADPAAPADPNAPPKKKGVIKAGKKKLHKKEEEAK